MAESLEDAPGLRALLAVLEAAGSTGVTAREIRAGTRGRVDAVSAAIDHLRKKGYEIPFSKPEERFGEKRKLYVYRLAKFVAAGDPPSPPSALPGELFPVSEAAGKEG